jgi:class 3 adenylate cyclase
MNTPHTSEPSGAYWLNRLLHYRPSLVEYAEDLFQAVTAHIPRTLARSILSAPTTDPLGLSLEGTLMFADIDGFTPLAERFAQAASEEGAEELTELVNRFLDILIPITTRYGGDLQKFGGDAGILLFQGEHHAWRAMAASLEMQAAMQAQMDQVATSLGAFSLKIATGLSSGRLIGLGLGDVAGQEWLLTGPPIAAVGRAQSAAPPNATVVDASTFEACAGEVEVAPVDEGLHLIQRLRALPPRFDVEPLPTPPNLLDAQRLQWYLSRLDALTPYLAPGLLDRLTSAPTLEHTRFWGSELRQVTILMLALDDPEMMGCWGDAARLQEALDAPNEIFVQIRDTIRRYDGIVDKIGLSPKGAYVMALFGAPLAHEDDPLRAVLAALELQTAFEQTLHFGINTGFVFAGDVGASERREYTVMGDEVNFAARLMATCPPGQIWLGPKTANYAVVARRIEGEQGEPLKFKGKEGKIAPFIAQRRRRVFLGAKGMETPLVGRQEEVAHFSDVLKKAADGAGRVVLVEGRAGVGKSRLVQEVVKLAEQRGFKTHMGSVPSYGEHLPFAAWDSVLRSLLATWNGNNNEGDDARLGNLSPEERQIALNAALARYGMATWAALIAPLMGWEMPPSSDVLSLPPNMRAMQRQTVLTELWQKAAEAQPRVLVIDNAHWMSPASLELLDAVVHAAASAPLLLVVTYREPPIEAEGWPELSNVIEMPLSYLSKEAMATLVQHLFQDRPLPKSVIDWVAERSSGLPLFATEAVRALIDSGILRQRADSWELSGELADFPLPDMVYGLIQSRIDQLSPPSRHLLRAAAVVGDEMTPPTLTAAYGEETESGVRRRLPQLSPFGLLPRDPTGDILVFRQPLVREVAYRGLPHRVQRLIHRRLAEYLDYHHEEATPNWLTLLAYHAFEGEWWEPAIATNLQLGRRALRSYLAVQSAQAFRRVLAATEGGDPAVAEARCEAHHLLGETLTILGEYETALAHLHQAREMLLADETSPASVARLADLDYHEAAALEALCAYDQAFSVIERGLNLPEVGATLEGARLYLMGASLLRRKKSYARAREWAEKSAALANDLAGEGAQQVHSRAMYMVALLASLQRLRRD